MRAIDADKLKEVLEKNFGHTGGASVLAQLIDAQDTIQPELQYKTDYGFMWLCPKCGLPVHSDYTKCVRCGHNREKGV